MDSFASLVEQQKRKRGQTTTTSTTSTSTSETSTIIKPSGVNKFQRRGDVVRQQQQQQPQLSAPTGTSINSDNIDSTSNNNLHQLVQIDPLPPTTQQQQSSTQSTIPSENDSINDPIPTNSPTTTETSTTDKDLILEQQRERLKQLEAIRHDKYHQQIQKSTFPTPTKYIQWSLKRYLWVWEQDLKQRSKGESESILGKAKTVEYYDTRRDLRPMFKQLKDNSIKRQIFDCLSDIVDACDEREYIRAQQAFYEVAIGNNPWPIGLPKVGIHERRAREKIDPSLIDHLLKDPVIQTYMQSLKRLLSFIEKRFPPQ